MGTDGAMLLWWQRRGGSESFPWTNNLGINRKQYLLTLNTAPNVAPSTAIGEPGAEGPMLLYTNYCYKQQGQNGRWVVEDKKTTHLNCEPHSKYNRLDDALLQWTRLQTLINTIDPAHSVGGVVCFRSFTVDNGRGRVIFHVEHM